VTLQKWHQKFQRCEIGTNVTVPKRLFLASALYPSEGDYYLQAQEEIFKSQYAI